MMCLLRAGVVGAVLLCVGSQARGEDFAAYVRTSEDFRRVRQDRQILLNRWDRWVLMPWRYKWGKAYDDELAGRMKAAGFNGGFCDHRPGKDAELHEKYGFLWYMDHTAGKGDLYLRENTLPAEKKNRLRAGPNRPRCLLDPAVQKRMKDNITAAVSKARRYKTRAAYALDDEVSWGLFTSPVKWDNSPASIADFQRWLLERYGSREAILQQWGPGSERFLRRMANPDDFQDLYDKPLSQWNLSPFCDALSYMDSQFLNLIGRLVEHANSVDPLTPCGFVGGQCPAAYGGYDYAKLARKVQFLEAYDIGCSMEIMRSLNPQNLIPLVQTGFSDPRKPQGRWFYWYYFAHGNRGVIHWADGWFKPGKNMLSVGRLVRRIERQSRKLVGARWMHDGVAIYYSHPSIQVSWFIDCQLHKRTWINRSSSMNGKLASTVGTFWAWVKLLEDAGLQYNFISYADLLEHGLDPSQYKVLILPRVLALSDAEAEAITDYVRRGGVVLADHMTGLFDQHGKARKRAALDELFGIASRPPATSATLFGGTCLAELDPEKYWNKTFIDAGKDIRPRCKRARGMVVAERELDCFAERRTGAGWAVHMNTSIMEYAGLRMSDYEAASRYRQPVVQYLVRAGLKPWVHLSVEGRRPDITEATYWVRDGRVYVFVVKNPTKFASEFGETKTEGVSSRQVQLTVRFETPKRDVRDELTGRSLGAGQRFTVPWRMDEVALLSLAR